MFESRGELANISQDPESTEPKDAQDELELLESAKEELRSLLRKTVTEAAGKAELDKLLAKFPQTGKDLFVLPSDIVDHGLEGDGSAPIDADNAKRDVGDGDGDQDDGAATATAAGENPFQSTIDAINHNHTDNTMFCDPAVSGTKDTVTLSIRNIGDVIEMDDEPQIDQLNNIDSFQALDLTVSHGLTAAAIEIPEDRFKVNMEHFEAIEERPETLKTVAKRAPIFENVYRRLDLADDNLWHVKVLIAQLRKNGLLTPGTDVELQKCLRRM